MQPVLVGPFARSLIGIRQDIEPAVTSRVHLVEYIYTLEELV